VHLLEYFVPDQNLMSNVLGDDKRQQILALGRLGRSLRRIEQATGVRRETARAYRKAAGINVHFVVAIMSERV
jgi:hypothetical protein